MRAAWPNPDAGGAQRELTALARALDKERPGAAASLRAKNSLNHRVAGWPYDAPTLGAHPP